MTKKPIFVEVYAWNEPTMALVALAWGLFLVLFGWESSGSAPVGAGTEILDGRQVIGAVIASGGVALLLIQMSSLRTFIDFRLPAALVKSLPRRLQPWILRMWPASTLVRLASHFFFTVWWLLMGTGVSLTIDDISDARLVLYFGFAALHFDRLLRLIQWMRKS